MYPVICRIGPVEVYSFGVMVALATIVCSFLMTREGKAFGIKGEDIYDLVFWAAVGGIVGARILYILLNFDFFRSDPLEIFMLNRGGLAWQGGLVLGSAAVVFVIKRKKQSIVFMADFMAPYLALGHAIGRIGCFLNGCCYGKDFIHGIYFPVHKATLHPTQLYESAALFLVFFLLIKLRKLSGRMPGIVFSGYLIAASLIRFIIEFFRADHLPLLFDLSIFQYISALMMILGLAICYNVLRRK